MEFDPKPHGSPAQLAIVHDYITQRGGAERVVLAMLRVFPSAALYTSLYDPGRTFPEFRSHTVRTMWMNRVSPLRSHHRLAMPLLAASFGSMHVDAPLTLCSSSGWSHGVKTTGRKLVYCHAPARWLYQADRYLGSTAGGARSATMSAGLSLLRSPLVRWDRRAAATADAYLVNSTAVQAQVRSIYGVQPAVMPPPVTDLTSLPYSPVVGIEPGYLLCVSRLLPYKNVDVLLESMRLLPGMRLVVVGDGPERARLTARAPASVRILRDLDDHQLAWLYRNCAAVVAPSFEDFGLVPVEAGFFGKPTAALAHGGYLDTIVDDVTGILFHEPTPPAIAASVRRLSEAELDEKAICDQANLFNEAAFAGRLRAAVRSLLDDV